MDRDQLVGLFCVEHGGTVPDEVVGAGRLIIPTYVNLKDWERAVHVTKEAGLPIVEDSSEDQHRGERLDLVIELAD